MVRKYWTSPSACFPVIRMYLRGSAGTNRSHNHIHRCPLPYLSYCPYLLCKALRDAELEPDPDLPALQRMLLRILWCSLAKISE